MIFQQDMLKKSRRSSFSYCVGSHKIDFLHDYFKVHCERFNTKSFKHVIYELLAKWKQCCFTLLHNVHKLLQGLIKIEIHRSFYLHF